MINKINALILRAQSTEYAGERRNAYSLAKRLIFKNNLQNNYKFNIKKEIKENEYLYYKLVSKGCGCDMQLIKNNTYRFTGYKKELDFLFKNEKKYVQLRDLNLQYLMSLSPNYVYENLMYWIAGYAVGITQGKTHVSSRCLPYTPMASDNYCRGVDDGLRARMK